MGSIELYLIYSTGGVWEEEWRELQGVIDIPEVTKEVMDHALRGYTRPLVDQLGPAPDGRLVLLPKTARACENVKTCSLFDQKRCWLFHKKKPWCFEPAGLKPGPLAAEVVNLWRASVYIVVVCD